MSNSTTSAVEPEKPIVTFKNPELLATPKGYAHSAEIDLGNCKMILMSGQVPVDQSGELVGKNDFAKQAAQVFLNIKSIVAAAGGTMDNIVKTGIFMKDISQVPLLREVRNRFINFQQPPVSTLVEVSSLFSEDWLIEIEATAIIPKKPDA